MRQMNHFAIMKQVSATLYGELYSIQHIIHLICLVHKKNFIRFWFLDTSVGLLSLYAVNLLVFSLAKNVLYIN